MKIILATKNNGKISEITEILQKQTHSLEVVGLHTFPKIGEIEETGKTFIENALLKARTVCKLTGLITLADDSGLMVSALDGAPGIYSARYSGENATDKRNIEKLLQNLSNFSPEQRNAKFVCALVAVAPNGSELIVEENWEGNIAKEPRGDNGFGYDSIFLVPKYDKTAAELPAGIKNILSHRGKALQKLLLNWDDFLIKSQN